MRHRELPALGVQFHPESVLTPDGKRCCRTSLPNPSSPGDRRAASRRDLAREQTAAVLAEIMAGNASEAQTAAC
jgi:hypothetical protein